MIDRAAMPGTSKTEDSVLTYWKAWAETLLAEREANQHWRQDWRNAEDKAFRANAALADALGLLREARRHVQADHSAGASWHYRVKALLANHPEPSP